MGHLHHFNNITSYCPVYESAKVLFLVKSTPKDFARHKNLKLLRINVIFFAAKIAKKTNVLPFFLKRH